jgi:alpha-tubulin suppressor-like RCC1 family protein
MRVGALFALAALVACYEAPDRDATCTILCTSECPGDLECVNGYCIAEGETCEPSFTQVRAGNGFACALDEVGRRWCWGANDRHQISSSDETQIVYATLIDDTRWSMIASGGDHACGIRTGELFCWGGNTYQQVTGGVIGDVSEPVRIAAPGGQSWKFVATGYNSTCAIADRLYCWGRGENFQLGTGTDIDFGIPTPVAAEITDWTSVSLGRHHACAISESYGLHCWGYNYYGQVGIGAAVYTSERVMQPTAVALAGVTSVAVAAYSTCAVADGQLYCWGYHGNNVLGDPALTVACNGPRTTPALASGLTGWTSVTAAQQMSCALRGDEVWCWGVAQGGGGLGRGVWGGNGWGRVTIGASDVSVGWNANIDEDGDTQDLDLACIIIDGKVQCWGDNRFGQLAQGGATMNTVPTEIAGNHVWSSMIAADVHTCGIADGGSLHCWGTMQNGQTIGGIAGTSTLPCGAIMGVPCTLGEPTNVPFHPSADQVAIGDTHTCARLGTTVTCWGSNNERQIGIAGSVSPNVVPGTWTHLYSPTADASCAVQNGETWCWGSTFSTRQDPAHDVRLDGARSITINSTIGDLTRNGSQRTVMCYLDAQSQLWCYGDNTYGQFGMGPPPAPVCGNLTCDFDEDNGDCPGDCPGTETCGTDNCTQLPVCSTRYSSCGDGICTRGYGETCSNCAADCGLCPLQATGRYYASISVGVNSSHSNVCGIRMDGHVECWGRNTNGQVGLTDTTTGRPIPYVYTPYEVPGLAQCTAVTSGENTSCAICADELWCWGNNRRGMVGDGKPTAVPIPSPRKIAVPLAQGDRLVQLTSGTGYSCARSEQGKGYCWGFHRYGALGTGGTSANLPIDLKLAPSP